MPSIQTPTMKMSVPNHETIVVDGEVDEPIGAEARAKAEQEALTTPDTSETIEKDEKKTSEFQIRTLFPHIELKGREVIFAVAVFFLFSLCIALITILVTGKANATEPSVKPNVEVKPIKNSVGYTSEPWGQGNKTGNNSKSGNDTLESHYCLKPQCLRSAAYLVDNMNRTANPCQDFWSFSCGGWIAKNPIPPTESVWSVDSLVEKRINNVLKEMLDKPVIRNSEDSAERKAKLFYAKCMDTESIDELGTAPLDDIIDSLGGWAIHEDWNIADKSGLWTIQGTLEKLQLVYEIHALFTLWVGIDDRNTSRNLIKFDQEGLSLENRALYLLNESHPKVTAFKEYMRSVALQFKISEKTADKFVNDTFAFETKLAKIQKPADSPERHDPMSSYQKLTVAELSRLSPRIDWLRFLQSSYDGITSSTEVLVTDRQYMSNVSKLLESTPERVINYYFIWRLVHSFVPVLSRSFREIERQYQWASKGLKRPKPRWKFCLDMVNEWFGMAVGAMFIKDHFPRRSKQDVTNMIMDIKQAFVDRLGATDLLDEKTREKALYKAAHLRYRIGYPEYLENHTKVDEYYIKFTALNNESFFRLYLNGMAADVLRIKARLNDTNDPNVTEWNMDPHAVNAYYSPTENLMVFPAGILQPPYFTPDLPWYINFGAIGATIGHEVTHGFDNYGSRYDVNGDLRVWWTDNSWEKYKNRSMCLRDFYSNYKVQNLQVNGANTLDENIADIIGLAASYKAFKKWITQNEKDVKAMPGLQLTTEQVFFLSYGQNWCSSETLEHLEDGIFVDNHAPAQIRVLGTLAQLPEFAKAFNCPVNSPMNPPEKCHIW